MQVSILIYSAVNDYKVKSRNLVSGSHWWAGRPIVEELSSLLGATTRSLLGATTSSLLGATTSSLLGATTRSLLGATPRPHLHSYLGRRASRLNMSSLPTEWTSGLV